MSDTLGYDKFSTRLVTCYGGVLEKSIAIDALSLIPLSLQTLLEGKPMCAGTGFVVRSHEIDYLITNWHVVTGRDPNTLRPLSTTGAADPEEIGIWHHDATRLGTWNLKVQQLLAHSTGAPQWRQHERGSQVDIVAVPLAVQTDTKTYPMDTTLVYTDLLLLPSEPVSIVGFPFGMSAAGKFPIWKTGHIASDIDLDYEDKPVFLIDATTTPGMSGAPVVARRIGMHRSSKGWEMGRHAVRFLGVYSGRIRKQSDIGMVWKPTVIDEILAP